MTDRPLILFALGVALVSFLLAQLLSGAADELLPRGPGFAHAAKGGEHHGLFRFDAIYYRDIAADGYSYDGDPHSSPNVVFTPLFPLKARLLSALTGLSVETAGFLVVHLCFALGCVFTALLLHEMFGATTAVVALGGLGFSAGSFSFHAYYSESTMLLWLALCFWLARRERYWLLIPAVAILGASRSTAGPFCLYFAGLLIHRGRKDRRLWLGVPVCFAGLAAYLAYLWAHFGNPFVLLPEIQRASWSTYHPPVSAVDVLTLRHLFGYWGEAFARGGIYLDPRSTNLVWTTLALVATIYGLARERTRLFTLPFALYFLLVYSANAGSVYLISTHRFFVLMLPIYVMLADLHAWLSERVHLLAAHGLLVVLLVLNLGQFAIWLVRFTQGYWFFF